MSTDPAATQRLSLPWTQWLIPLGLLVATAAAYYPALHGDFIWDDDYYVVHNRALQTFDGIQQLWLGIFPDWRRYPVPQYYPMTHTSLWLDYRFWGLNPTGYHATNIILHTLSAWTLLVILRRLAIPGALLAAFVFALHPVHVESVAWITERKNVLSGLFYLLSLLVYLRYAKLDGWVAPQPAPPDSTADKSEQRDYEMTLPAEPWKVYALSLLLFVLAILSKSVTATLPGAILLITCWKRRRIAIADVLPLIPFFVLGLAMSVFTGAMEKHVVGAVGPEWDYTLAQRIVIAGRAVWFYVGKLLWPANLVFMYEKWTIDASSAAAWIAPLLVVATLVALFLARKRLGIGLLLGLLYFGGTILPALGFFNYFPMRYAFVADHFAYLASLGLIVPICAFLAARFAAVRALGIALGAALCLALGFLSFRQAHVYAGPESVWRHTLERNPNSWMARNNLGVLLLDRGDLDGAEEQFSRVVDLKRDHGEAVLNLGRVAEKRGNIAQAEQLYQLASQINDAKSRVEKQRYGIVRGAYAAPHLHLAALSLARNDLKEAEEQYRLALGYNPVSAVALSGLGELMRRRGDSEQALALQEQAMELDPASPQVRLNLGSALAANGRMEEALFVWGALLREDPTNAEAANNIGLYFVAREKWVDAIKMFEMALKNRPDFATARQNLEAAQRRAATQPATQAVTQPATRPG